MKLLSYWKIHLLALLITIVAEYIGIRKFGLMAFLPLLYALVMGFIISIPKLKLLTEEQMIKSAGYLNVAIMILMAKVGLGIGPNLTIILESGWAILFQEVGHFLGTIILGLPVALLVGMRREAVGACYSVDREPNIAIITDRFGFDSPEGRGVMGMYICGTLFGAMWISVLSGFIAGLDIFHPYALALGTGVGSASMMAAGTGSIIANYPDLAKEVTALAGAANLLTTVLGVYIALFVSLPIMERAYNWATGRTREEDLALDAKDSGAMGDVDAAHVVTSAGLANEKDSDTIFSKACNFLFVLIIAALITGVGNAVDGKHTLVESLVGAFIIAALAFGGAILSYLPGLKRFPMVFWVSMVGVIASIPGVPGSEWIVAKTTSLTFLATTTPVLAYAGLSLGKDIPAFRRLSWRIVPVGIAVATGTFLFAAIMAEITLHLEGVI